MSVCIHSIDKHSPGGPADSETSHPHLIYTCTPELSSLMSRDKCFLFSLHHYKQLKWLNFGESSFLFRPLFLCFKVLTTLNVFKFVSELLDGSSIAMLLMRWLLVVRSGGVWSSRTLTNQRRNKSYCTRFGSASWPHYTLDKGMARLASHRHLSCLCWWLAVLCQLVG